MLKKKLAHKSQLGYVILVLLSGLAFLPFTSLTADELGWQLYAQIYNPTLEIDEDKGSPGSSFLFVGAGYPPNATATVYVDGSYRGQLTTDSSGRAEFLIQTEADDLPGRYFVTLSTDSNNVATDDFRLEEDEPIIMPPPGFDGLVFNLSGSLPALYLPIIR